MEQHMNIQLDIQVKQSGPQKAEPEHKWNLGAFRHYYLLPDQQFSNHLVLRPLILTKMTVDPKELFFM